MATETAPSPARERVLTTAFGLFYAHGLRGVGIDRIIAESGVAKATFYRHFPAKDDLVLAYLDQVDEIWTSQLHEAAAAAGADPAEQLVGMFDALVSACHRDGYRGCAFINAAAENGAGTPIHSRTLLHKTAVRKWVRGLAERAGATDPDALARALTLLLDGGLASGSIDRQPDAPQTAKESARTLVTAALAQSLTAPDRGRPQGRARSARRS